MAGPDSSQAPQSPEAERLAAYDVLRLRAHNPGPLTLSGTNTWVIGREPAYVIDPGPALDAHVEELTAAVQQRGGLGGIALTHDHYDHCEAVPILRALMPAPLACATAQADLPLSEGVRLGPLKAMRFPGHSSDHYIFFAGRVCFTGDAVLGEGSVFIAPEPGAMSGYLKALEHLRECAPVVLCPGHGPAVWEVQEKITEYIEHRLDRERRLLAALRDGRRTVAELIQYAWSDVPAELRAMAVVTLAAHLDKLEDEGRLPADVQRPSF